jgi:spore maturation protein CgeB
VRVVIFCHSLISDWNHGNAHFLRGVASELIARGHEVIAYEPEDAWSVNHLVAEHGEDPIARFRVAYPQLRSHRYRLGALDLDRALDGAGLVLVHEWNEPDLVRRVGEHRARSRGYRLLFHDTHHRSVTDSPGMARYPLGHYDGVLAFGEVIREIYLQRGWAQRAWTWHEAADTRVFHPQGEVEPEGDLIWVGNWGDGERCAELRELLLEPTRALGLRGKAYGVRYPPEAKAALEAAGLAYAGWLPNFEVPGAFARFRVTVHLPRRPYVQALPGIPTIRPFEALACGIPLVSAPWSDLEGLFEPGEDFLVAATADEMKRQLRRVLEDRALASELSSRGLRTIRSRHTCAHRVDQLFQILAELRESGPGEANG